MNLYFLVEGRTEKIIYSRWLSYLLPQLKRVKNFNKVTQKSYYIFSADGYPRIKNRTLPNAIADINANGTYNYLVVCLDADESTVEEREKEIFAVLDDHQLTLKTAKLIVIVQNRCIETWFLGNRTIFRKDFLDVPLRNYIHYYNISEKDPELMGQYKKFNTHSQFHAAYFKELLRANHKNYSKGKPSDVQEKFYLEQLQLRIQQCPKHLKTFGKFIEFCDRVKANL